MIALVFIAFHLLPQRPIRFTEVEADIVDLCRATDFLSTLVAALKQADLGGSVLKRVWPFYDFCSNK